MAETDFNFYLHVPVLASGGTMKTQETNKTDKYDPWGTKFKVDRITYEEIFTQYSDRFKNIYDPYKEDILKHLKLIGFTYVYDETNNTVSPSFAEQLVTFLKGKIIPLSNTTESTLKDANLCLKALEALDYYVNEIIVAFSLLDEYITKAQKQLKLLGKCNDEITKEAPKLEDYQDDENSTAEEQYEAARTEYYEAIDKNRTLAHINITNLKIYDKFCMDIVNKFAQCLDATLYADTDTTVSSDNSALTLNYSNIKNLRETKLKKNTVFSNFNQLNLLDRFIYTYLYCSLKETADGKRAYFPDDPMVGYPCLPTKKNQSPSEIDTEIGALEMFYIGYLIDRDGPVNALSTFMDVKVEALRRNIELNTNKIEALTKYLTLFNLALQEVNRTQSKEKENPIPGFARFVAYYLAQNGCLREMVNINGENYIIMAGSYELNNEGYHVSNSKEFNYEKRKYYPTYLLIKATDKAFNELKNKLNGKNYENTDHPYYNPSSPTATINGDKITVTENNNFYKIWIFNAEYTFLPKELEIATVTAPDKWDKDQMTTNNIQAWTTVFSTKTDYINHRIETINTDISTLRTKIDTFESASSTYRNRAHDTYSNIIRNIS